jgi:hypothetical protein
MPDHASTDEVIAKQYYWDWLRERYLKDIGWFPGNVLETQGSVQTKLRKARNFGSGLLLCEFHILGCRSSVDVVDWLWARISSTNSGCGTDGKGEPRGGFDTPRGMY